VDSLGVRESAVGEVEKRIGERIGKLGEPLFLVARPATVEKAEADFEAMERQGLRWRQAGLVGRFLSPGAFLPPPSAQREAREWLSLYGLPGRYSGADLERRIRAETERQGMGADEGPRQVANVAHLPGIVTASLAMPDMHWGYGFPI
jgi:hypothetical protein